MKFAIGIGLFASVLALALANVARFDNSKVYAISIKDNEQLQQIRTLSANAQIRSLDDLANVGYTYNVIVEKGFVNDFENLLNNLHINFDIILENLQNAIQNIISSDMEWTQYHDLDDIYNWLDHIAVRDMRHVRPFIIGHSYQGRPIRGIRISHGIGRKAIVIDSQIHAIEWISSAASTCFINNLLNSDDPELTRLRQSYDWYFMPVINPDGFVYTKEVQPLWRKNLKPTGYANESGPCLGTDMNRNFDINWKSAGYNVDVPCDHWYGGNSPASEPEVQALQNFLLSLPEGYARIYIAIHSYGNMLLLPYGHTNETFPLNYDQMMSISKGFADAARVKYGTEFLYGASGSVLYPVSGSAKDFAYSVAKIPYTATLELRDRGTYGFFLPADQILEVCAEITDGFIGMVQAAENEGLFN